MFRLTVDGRALDLAVDESVLEAALRQGVALPCSCRAGVCRSCLVRTADATPVSATAAIKGVKDTLAQRGFALACQWRPNADVAITLQSELTAFVETTVSAKTALAPEIVEVSLAVPPGFSYYSGQYVNLKGPAGLIRSYSLASLPSEDDCLRLHIQRIAGGRMSGWIHDELRVGQTVSVSQPQGDCFYLCSDVDQPLLCIGTGSGLAPLYGIVRDALSQGHRGEVFLYHGVRGAEGLYLRDELSALEDERANFHYVPCVSGGAPPFGVRRGGANELALADHGALNGYRLYLCGNPEMVRQTQRAAYLQGAALSEIYADAFVAAAAAERPVVSSE